MNFVSEPRLADARVAEHRHQLRAARSPMTSRSAWSIAASSSSRPTIGESRRRT